MIIETVSFCRFFALSNLTNYIIIQGHEFYNPQMKNRIYVREVSVEMKAKQR